MLEKGSFPDGIFIPKKAIDSGIHPTEVEPTQSTLTEREQGIFDRLGHEENKKSFALFMESADTAIVSEQFGFEAIPSPRHKQLQRFYRRTLVDMDGAFDTDRASFSEAIKDGDTFLAALYAVPITRVGEPVFTAGEALSISSKLMADPDLYSTKARALLRNDSERFVNLGIKEMGRKDSPTLNGQETQQVKETTNGLYAALLFDISYGEFIDNKGYSSARDRYIATKLAFQYQDDIMDVATDVKERSANMVSAFARDLGEELRLKVALPQLEQSLPELEQAFKDTSYLTPYYEMLHEATPRSYGVVVARQRELLDIASLPPKIADKM